MGAFDEWLEAARKAGEASTPEQRARLDKQLAEDSRRGDKVEINEDRELTEYLRKLHGRGRR